MSQKPVFAVLGGGHGGFGMTADLTLQGFEARLFELPEFSWTIEPVIEQGGIAIRGVVGEGFARPAAVTADIQEALAGADIVMVVVPAFGHKTMAKTCAPFLEDGQIVVLNPGCCGGALEFAQVLKNEGCQRDLILAETTSLLYAVKKEGTAGVWVRGLKHDLPLATFPATQTEAVLARLKPAFPQFVPAVNVLDTSLNNLNNMAHPPVSILNLGLVEGKRFEEWYMYLDGCTPSVCRVEETIDVERLEIVRAFGLPEVSDLEWNLRYYGHQGMRGKNLYEINQMSPIHGAARGPRTTKHRYYEEDIPYGLVPLASLGKLVGVPTPTMDALITLGSVINETDYRSEGRTVERLGLAGMTVEEIKRFVTEGPM